jgi:hypothetical protein
MTENNVNAPITDQEKAFAILILSGTMTDRQAAEVVGLNPESATYTKSKPCVRDYLLEHRPTIQPQILEQDNQELRRFDVGRDRVLTRLWDIANMEPERTRNSMSSQVKAISMIVAIEGLIPDRHSARRGVSAENKPAAPPDHPGFYQAEWLRNRQNGVSADPQPSPAPEPEEAGPELQTTPGGLGATPPVADPTPNLGESAFSVHPLNPSQTTSSVPRVPMADYFAPDTRTPFSLDKNRFKNDNRFGRRR